MGKDRQQQNPASSSGASGSEEQLPPQQDPRIRQAMIRKNRQRKAAAAEQAKKDSHHKQPGKEASAKAKAEAPLPGDARPERETQTTGFGGETLADTKLESKHETHEQKGAGVKTDITSTQTSSIDKDGVHGQHAHREETHKGDMTKLDEKKYGVDVGKDGVKASREHTTGETIGDDKKTTTHGQSLSAGAKGVELGLESKHREEKGDQTHEHKESGSVGAGPDGVRAQYGRQSTDAEGNQRGGSLSGEIGAHHAEVAGEVSSQTADGHKVAAGGHVKFGKDGAEVGADATFGKAKFSASGGIQVEADDPVALDGGTKFVVDYKVTGKLAGSIGAKGGTFGASLGGSESEFQTGTRMFYTLEAAQEFQKDAAERIEAIAANNPDSADSVLHMEVGESAGEGKQSGWNAGGSGAMDGASAEISGGKQHSNGVSVERVSEDEADVTIYKASGNALGLGAGGFGFSQSSGSDSSEEESITLRFNLKDPEGRAEFERYVRNPDFFPKHGKLVGSAGFESATGSEGTSFGPIGSAGYTSRHSKSEVAGENGSRSSYVGEANQDSVESANLWEAAVADQQGISEDQFMRKQGKEQHNDWRMSAQMEDGHYKDDDHFGDRAEFQIEGKVGGESGGDNWQHMSEMTHADTENMLAEDAGDIQSSGNWKLSASIRASDMEGFAVAVMREPHLTAGPRYDLQQQLRKAADENGGLPPEDMVRIVTEYFAARGPDALADMRENIHPSDADGSGAGPSLEDDLESLDETKALQWDVELEGDKNFPGVPGRHELEKKQEEYTASLVDPSKHAKVAAAATEDLKALRERREAVQDLTRYRDLPIGLKRREIQKIDANIEKLQSLRHLAAVSQTELQGEAEEPKDPKTAELHQLRKEIIELDREIKNLSSTRATRGVEQAIDEMRQQFLKAANPETAIVLGKLLLAQLKTQRDML
jgi:hypothetical protein